jgi:hypothetical protein
MMISSAGASDPYAAAAALDRQLRSSKFDPDESSSDGAAPDASPDVVVTLGKASSSPAAYDASGRMSGAPTLDDMGANAPDSLAKASESHGDDDDADSDATSASSSTGASASTDDSSSDASVDEDAAVAA